MRALTGLTLMMTLGLLGCAPGPSGPEIYVQGDDNKITVVDQTETGDGGNSTDSSDHDSTAPPPTSQPCCPRDFIP